MTQTNEQDTEKAQAIEAMGRELQRHGFDPEKAASIARTLWRFHGGRVAVTPEGRAWLPDDPKGESPVEQDRRENPARYAPAGQGDGQSAPRVARNSHMLPVGVQAPPREPWDAQKNLDAYFKRSR